MLTFARTVAAVSFAVVLLASPLVSREVESQGSFDIVGTAMMKVNGKAAPMTFIGWFDYDFATKECAFFLDDIAFDGTLAKKGKSGEWIADFKSGFKLAFEEDNDGKIVKVTRYRVTNLVLEDGLVSGRLSARYRVTNADGTKESVAIEGSFAGTDAFGF